MPCCIVEIPNFNCLKSVQKAERRSVQAGSRILIIGIAYHIRRTEPFRTIPASYISVSYIGNSTTAAQCRIRYCVAQTLWKNKKLKIIQQSMNIYIYI